MKRCSSCKTLNDGEALFCSACGKSIFEPCNKPGRFASVGKCILYVLAFLVVQIVVSFTIASCVAFYQLIIYGQEITEEMLLSLNLILADVSNIVFLAGLFIFIKIRKKEFTEEVRLKKFSPWIVPLCVVFGFSANIALSAIFSFIPWPTEWIESYSESSASLLSDNIWINILSICILTGIVEEIAFRGIVVTRLRRAFGPVFTVIASAAIFALIHMTPTSMPPIFVFAIFLGAIFLKYDSVIPTIIIHATFNFAAIVPSPDSPILIWAEIFICLALFILTAYLLLQKKNSTEAVEN